MLGIIPPCHAAPSSDKTAADGVTQAAQDQRGEAIHKTKTALDNLDKRIDALETHIDKSWDKMNKAAPQNARASPKRHASSGLRQPNGTVV